jgi:hypothetical protein
LRVAWRPREGRKGCRRGKRSSGFYRRRGAIKSAGDQPNQGERKSRLGESSPTKFPAGVRDDTRAPLVRERSKTDTGSGDNPGWAAAASVTGPKSLPRSVSKFFSSFFFSFSVILIYL